MRRKASARVSDKRSGLSLLPPPLVGGRGEPAANPYQDLPDGVIHELRNSLHQISVVKQGDDLHLVYFQDISGEIQARFRPARPDYLVSPYTQAMMLAVVLKSRIANVYVLGFGGGRIPMALRRMDANMRITCAETDRDVIGVAQQYFGARLDRQLRVRIGDGRRFLENSRSRAPYDLIFVDASDGTGAAPVRLCTREFFAACKKNLARGGVLVLNLHYSDCLYFDKVATLCYSFPSVRLLPVHGGYAAVLFASLGEFEPADRIVQRAEQMDASCGDFFPLARHAAAIQSIAENGEYQSALRSATILADG